jgi:hypothetical protein
MCGWSDDPGGRNIASYLIELLHYAFNHDLGFAVGQSWEQLWLAYYMKTEHNKIWNGEKWEND